MARAAAAIGAAIVLSNIGIGGYSYNAIAAMTASVGSPKLNALVERLQHHYQTTQSFSASFKETLVRPGMPPRERTGMVYYEKPGRMRWDFGDPQPETIVSDGAMIYDYDPGLNQVVETPLKRAFKTEAAAAFILGAGNLRRDFNAAPVAGAPSDGLDHLALTPKGGGDTIELGADPKTFDIATITIADSMGNKTELAFSGFKRNVSLKPSLFAFAPPPGADIVSSQGTQ